MCTSTLNCTHYCLLLLAKIGEGHTKIRPEYVSVVAHKTSFCKNNFVHFLVRIVWNTDILRLHFLSAFLYNIPFGRPKKTRLDWNLMVVSSFRSVVIMISYCVEIWILYSKIEAFHLSLARRLVVNAKKAKCMFVSRQQNIVLCFLMMFARIRPSGLKGTTNNAVDKRNN